MGSWVVFDDDARGLAPLCDLRASFELRTGALTTLERLTRQFGAPPASLIVPPGIAKIVAARHEVAVNELPRDRELLLINGRCSRFDAELPIDVNSALVDAAGEVMMARLDRDSAARFIAEGCRTLPGNVTRVPSSYHAMLRRPWHVLLHAEANLAADLELLAHRLRPLNPADAPGIPGVPGVVVVGSHPVLLGKGAVVHPHVVFDTTAGPIALDDRAEVRSMSVVVGPGYIGRGSVVANHAHIRGRCVIGPVCKVGGEVNASVFQGHSNKAHSGYLGNSFIGEWVNLGAGTVTSNLKNTYGEVRVQQWPSEDPQPTGMHNLGSIIGDHVKTAIGTRLMTGSIIHTGAMLAGSGFPPKCAPPFAFITDEGEQVYELDKFCEVAGAMMSRREQTVDEAMRERLEALWNTAREPERRLR